MDTIFRTHVKTEKRFELLKRSIYSAVDKDLLLLGPITVIDDCSPPEWKDKIIAFASSLNINTFSVPKITGDTRQGLAYSLINGTGEPTLHCVDDIVFGKGAYAEFKRIRDEYIPQLEARNMLWGMIGSFACYNREPSFTDIPLWYYPIPHFYAMVCHIVNPKLAMLYCGEYDKWKEGKPIKVDPNCCDDIFIKQLCAIEGFTIFNTLKDYSQHTGAFCRTFGEENAPSSNYISNHFVGE